MEDRKIFEFINSTDALFHYTNRINAIDFILSTGKLRLSPFCRTDDPLEYKDWMVGITGGLIQGQDNELFINLEDNYNRIIKTKTFFLSFSENKNKGLIKIRGYNRSRMWSQYGEHHKGVCLVFSEMELLKEIQKDKHQHGLISINSITYKNKLPLKGIILKRKILKKQNHQQQIIEFIKTNLNNIFFN